MRKILIAAVVALVAIMPMAVHAQAPGQAPTPATEEMDWFYPLFMAAGAVAGVVAVNLFTSGYVGMLPYTTGLSGVGPITDATATGLSRVMAVTGIVTGGWIANWLYTGR